MSPFHVLFVFGAGLMSDVWTGAPFGSHGVMFAWMMMMARSPLARAGMIARVLASWGGVSRLDGGTRL